MLVATLKQVPPIFSHQWTIVHVVMFIQRMGSYYQTAVAAPKGSVDKLLSAYWPPIAAVEKAREERLHKEVENYVKSGPLLVTPLRTKRR
jgi:hypothetical protein